MTNRFNRARGFCASAPAAPGRGVRGLAVGALTAAAATMLLTGCGGGHTAASDAGPKAAQALGKLPQATTFTTLKGLDSDTATALGNGTVVHPDKTLPVSAAPGGPAVAALPSTQLGGPTWVPVMATKPGWDEVLLPSRPNHAAGWIPSDGLHSAHSPYQITVNTTARRLTLTRSGQQVGTWTVAVGAAKTPTPTGRTFLLASLAPATKTYSPLILPIGAHSETLDNFGGGPGTVAFHGWPSASVFGKAITHGCVRVPAGALKKLAEVPLGTPVLVTA